MKSSSWIEYHGIEYAQPPRNWYEAEGASQLEGLWFPV